ncbi:MAG: phosphopantetheine-containing protein [Hyphomicrobiales bacterium]|nr:phosphopantetheine-containing protein [Hyphomicrobiales bacterium]
MPQDIAAATIKVIASHLNIDASALSLDRSLDEFGVTSLQLAEIIVDLEDMFDIEIDQNTAEAWASLKTVGNLVEAVQVLADRKA